MVPGIYPMESAAAVVRMPGQEGAISTVQNLFFASRRQAEAAPRARHDSVYITPESVLFYLLLEISQKRMKPAHLAALRLFWPGVTVGAGARSIIRGKPLNSSMPSPRNNVPRCSAG